MSDRALVPRPDDAPAKRPGWRPTALLRGAAAEMRCALIGPVGAGKTAFLDSLDHPAELACSRPRRRLLRAPEKHLDPGETALIVAPAERSGLVGGGSRRRRLRVIERSLETEGGGELDAEAALLFLAADGLDDLDARTPLLELTARLADPRARAPKRLVICLSKYERLFLRAGRDAVWRASHPDRAREILAWSFGDDGPYGYLRPALSAAARRREIWVQPVSSFGFVAGSGGANVTPEGAERRTRWLDRLKAAQSAGERDWRPYLTHDALILAAEGRGGRLSFRWRQLVS